MPQRLLYEPPRRHQAVHPHSSRYILRVQFHLTTLQGVLALLFPCLPWAFLSVLLFCRDFQHTPQSLALSFVVSI